VERSYGLCIVSAFMRSIARLVVLFHTQQADPTYAFCVSASSGSSEDPYLYPTLEKVRGGADEEDEGRHGPYPSQQAMDDILQGTLVAALPELIHCTEQSDRQARRLTTRGWCRSHLIGFRRVLTVFRQSASNIGLEVP